MNDNTTQAMWYQNREFSYDDLVRSMREDEADIGKELLKEGKSIVYHDKSISDEYPVLENPLGEKFLVTLDKDTYKTVIVSKL
ncbi:hypothetical protein AGMMS50229_19420 [Campylobacterota bacterium]|nr:hypothetical protein AGMMS50229_19420 [Campylobacterota bacterium]